MKKLTTCLLLFIIGHGSLCSQEFVIDYNYYPAIGPEKNIAIMYFGGSSGGYPFDPYYQNKLTKLGYPCIGVAYFKTKNTPKILSEIPLEYFEQAIEMYLERPEIMGKKLVIIGISKGGELSLLLASKYSGINGVIAEVPSHVVWEGINADWGSSNSSSWSYQGEPIPYVPDDTSSQNSFLELYELSLQQKEYVEKARIPVEKIKGPILIVSGVDDKMWPSTFMGDEVIKRLKDNNFPYWYRHDAYQNAGHILHPKYLRFGGTKKFLSL
ncbi:MAG: acyl-CoA thioester hydrolase/BAAT C-terminal domain-containing protein, partial [Bacteroidota bacterium]